MRIVLPFPPASLSGHNTGHWRTKSGEIKALRMLAAFETRKVKPTVPAEGDIPITIRFVPPDKRGDRMNFPNRIKCLIDGIADGLKVNDKRFLPMFIYAEPEKDGRVEFYFADPRYPQATRFTKAAESAMENSGPSGASNTNPALTVNAIQERLGYAS